MTFKFSNLVMTLATFTAINCISKPILTGMYFQWGYNKEWYTHSNIHFKMSNGNDFTLYRAVAQDRTDFKSIITSTKDITVPQYNLRIGFYLNETKSKGFEINFDHTKYVVTNFQKLHIKGTIDQQHIDTDTILDPQKLLHFEHSDGANFLHFNYFQTNTLLRKKSKDRAIFSSIWKIGAGINIPRTDFTWQGEELNNKFHVAGYNASVEGGARWYISKNFFLEGTAKTGYVRYIDALADTETQKGNRAYHGFGYFEFIGTLGYNISFKKQN